MANRLVEIGEFTVHPPLGVEHIQLIAANYDLAGWLPPTRWDEELGYHVIRGSENVAMAGLEKFSGAAKSLRFGHHKRTPAHVFGSDENRGYLDSDRAPDLRA